jgi:hypothetical protein
MERQAPLAKMVFREYRVKLGLAELQAKMVPLVLAAQLEKEV